MFLRHKDGFEENSLVRKETCFMKSSVCDCAGSLIGKGHQ